MPDTRLPVTTTCYLTRNDLKYDGEIPEGETWLELEFLSNYYSSHNPPEFKLIACTEPTEVNDAIRDATKRLEALWAENKDLKEENQNIRKQLEEVRGLLRLAGRGIVLP